MAAPAATASAKSLIKNLHYKFRSRPELFGRQFSVSAATKASYGTLRSKRKSENERIQRQKQREKAELLLKRRTRSERDLDEEDFLKQYGNDSSAHVPVLLGEVLDVFASLRLESFVDCTLGAGGHSAAIIEGHPELEFYVGLDVDPIAHQIGQARINAVVERGIERRTADLQVHTLLRNFKSIKTVLHDIDGKHRACGVPGVLMDLGMSSMQVNGAERGFSVLADGPLDMRMNPQASLKAEDILNLWPDAEVGRILRDYGEESNWLSLQRKIIKARLSGGLHSTGDLVDLIKSSTSWTRGGRQGWIKTATRVFQALRIAVNDELNTLKDSIHLCFDSLAPGGRLAVISFHSLEDRIVKQTFLDIINHGNDTSNQAPHSNNSAKADLYKEQEAWIKQIVLGPNASILTKRPVTPSESEERLNPRSRSAKLRVIEKV